MEILRIPSALVAIDLDGTLLNNEHQVSSQNRQALSTLAKQGAAVVLASGRTELMMRKYILELGIEYPVISCNGALITDPKTRNILSQTPIPTPVLEQMLDHAVARRLDIFLYTPAQVLYSASSRRISIMKDYNRSVPVDEQIPLEKLPDSMHAILERLSAAPVQPVLKMLVSYPAPEDMAYYNSLDSVESVVSQAESLDIMSRGATKGAALRQLSDWMQVPQSRIFAFGDQHNDLPMLHEAGHALVPENGTDEAKAAADLIVPANDASGVAFGINEYILKRLNAPLA